METDDETEAEQNPARKGASQDDRLGLGAFFLRAAGLGKGYLQVGVDDRRDGQRSRCPLDLPRRVGDLLAVVVDGIDDDGAAPWSYDGGGLPELVAVQEDEDKREAGGGARGASHEPPCCCRSDDDGGSLLPEQEQADVPV